MRPKRKELYERLDPRAPNMKDYGNSHYDLVNHPGRTVDSKVKHEMIMTPAECVVRRFGGVYRLCNAVNAYQGEDAVKLSPSTVYRWMYPKEKGGMGGLIPNAKVELVLRAARYSGVLIVPEDLTPKPFHKMMLK